MALFKKDPPRACPKCGKADGWHILDNESSAVDYGESFDVRLQPGGHAGSAVDFGDRYREILRPGGYSSNQFTDMRIQNSRTGVLTYHCDGCGYEKAYHV